MVATLRELAHGVYLYMVATLRATCTWWMVAHGGNTACNLHLVDSCTLGWSEKIFLEIEKSVVLKSW